MIDLPIHFFCPNCQFHKGFKSPSSMIDWVGAECKDQEGKHKCPDCGNLAWRGYHVHKVIYVHGVNADPPQVPNRLLLGEAHTLCSDRGVKLNSFEGYEDRFIECPFEAPCKP